MSTSPKSYSPVHAHSSYIIAEPSHCNPQRPLLDEWVTRARRLWRVGRLVRRVDGCLSGEAGKLRQIHTGAVKSSPDPG